MAKCDYCHERISEETELVINSPVTVIQFDSDATVISAGTDYNATSACSIVNVVSPGTVVPFASAEHINFVPYTHPNAPVASLSLVKPVTSGTLKISTAQAIITAVIPDVGETFSFKNLTNKQVQVSIATTDLEAEAEDVVVEAREEKHVACKALQETPLSNLNKNPDQGCQYVYGNPLSAFDADGNPFCAANGRLCLFKKPRGTLQKIMDMCPHIVIKPYKYWDPYDKRIGKYRDECKKAYGTKQKMERRTVNPSYRNLYETPSERKKRFSKKHGTLTYQHTKIC